MKLEKIVVLFHTVKFLKFIQVYYRLYYLTRNKVRRWRGFSYSLSIPSLSTQLSLQVSIASMHSFEDGKFTFLNLAHTFEDKIDWNFSDYGKLWTYNLNYFEYLNQENMSKEDGETLIHDFIEQSQQLKDGLEPFPISLRGINWIKYLSIHGVNNKLLDGSLYAQYYILLDNLEYHLLGNHLLENGFSLLFGSYYFKDEKLYRTAKKILVQELKEQILNDGAHFELSPMYHQIMLYRVLDCINLVQNNSWKSQELFELLQNRAEVMLGWLDIITFENGNIPLLNDSANNIAPSTKQLNQYAATLQIDHRPSTINHPLKESGYRKIKKEQYECIVDVGNIGPDYIPGHAHSDTFNFELYVDGKPFIIDAGLSTYEPNVRRIVERSTASHNTVEIEGIDQSEVWGAFRVASRAKITDLVEKENYIKAVHNGYKKRLGALHQREFLFYEKSIKIIDRIESGNSLKAIARLHLYPGLKPIVEGSIITLDEIKICLNTENARVKVENYYYAPEFNTLSDAQVIEIYFTDHLEMEVQL